MTMTVIGIAPKVLAASAVGAAVGMVLGTGKLWERLVRGTVGCAVALIGHPVGGKVLGGVLNLVLADKWMPTQTDLDVLAGFAFGLVGMVACQAAINAMTAVRDHADEFVEERIGGEDK